jgi:lipopolysaccharide biosynthesis protein
MKPRRRRAVLALHERLPLVPRSASGQGDWGGSDLAQVHIPLRTLVICHVYYPELWGELAERIEFIPGPVSLAVTLVEGRADHLEPLIRARFPRADVRVVRNRGRDLWPLLQTLDLLPGHDAVLKLHTKRSPHMRNGDAWRRQLLDGVCTSRDHVRAIQTLLATGAPVGLVAPPGNVLGREFMGNNGIGLASLAARGQRPVDAARLWFPAGSIFWARPAVLAPLLELGLTAVDFGDETGAVDGTLPHALERYIGVIAQSEGLAVVESSEVPDLLRQLPPAM